MYSNWNICIYIPIYKESALMIIEAEWSQELQSANWRPRRTDGVSSSLDLSSKAGDDLGPSLKQSVREKSPLAYLFVLLSLPLIG